MILMQHGRGADAGAAYGSGSSATDIGARGSGSFLSRTTAALATLFFVTSMVLAYFASQVSEPQDLMEGVEIPARVDTDVPAPAGQVVPTPGSIPVPAGGEARSDVPAIPAAPPPTSAEGPEPTPSAAGDIPLSVPEQADLPVRVPQGGN
jgi:preprotein translocase subunit SecG